MTAPKERKVSEAQLKNQIAALYQEIDGLRKKLERAEDSARTNYELAVAYGAAVRQQAKVLEVMAKMIDGEPGESRTVTFAYSGGKWSLAK